MTSQSGDGGSHPPSPGKDNACFRFPFGMRMLVPKAALSGLSGLLNVITFECEQGDINVSKLFTGTALDEGALDLFGILLECIIAQDLSLMLQPSYILHALALAHWLDYRALTDAILAHLEVMPSHAVLLALRSLPAAPSHSWHIFEISAVKPPGAFTLDFALRTRNWALAQMLVHVNPDAARRSIEQDGSNPIPVVLAAVFTEAPISFAKQVLDLYPEATMTRNYGGYPLFFNILAPWLCREPGQERAEGYDSSDDLDGQLARYRQTHAPLPELGTLSELCMKLIEVNPRAATLQAEGVPALHLALRVASDIEVCFKILELCPSALQRIDESGNYPLHVALIRAKIHCNDQLIAFILQAIEAYPQAVQHANKAYQLPLHLTTLAIRNCTEIYSKLLQVYPAAAEHTDMYGWLPIHTALKSNHDASIILLLLDAYPGACGVRTPAIPERVHIIIGKSMPWESQGDSGVRLLDSNALPIHLACMHRPHDVGLLSKLLEIQPLASKETPLPIHLLSLNIYPGICSPSEFDPLLLKLLDLYPESVKHAGLRGRMLLHDAIYQGASADFCLRLMQMCPEYASPQRSSRGSIGLCPLQLAFNRVAWTADMGTASDDIGEFKRIIQALFELNPSALRGDRGATIYKIAAQSEVALDILLEIASRTANSYNEAGIKSLLFQQTTQHAYSRILDVFPDGAGVQNSNGNLPLHHVLAGYGPPDIVSHLLKLYPDAIQHSNAEGKLPLHLAICSLADVDVTLNVLKLFPDAAWHPLADGQTALHLAAACSASPAVVKELLMIYRKAVQTPDDKGRLPLHLALEARGEKELIDLLLTSHPAAAERADERGLFPVQIAIQKLASPELVVSLLTTYPAAAGMISWQWVGWQDELGSRETRVLAPIQWLLMQNAEPQTILNLINLLPQSVTARNEDDGSLPLHTAALRGPDSIFEHLLELYPEAVSESNSTGCRPLHFALGWTSRREWTVKVIHDGAPPEIAVRMMAATPTEATLMKIALKSGLVSPPLILEMVMLQRYGDSEVLFHAALAQGSDEVCMALLDLDPSVAHQVDESGDSPLHLALQHRETQAIALKLIEHAPATVCLEGNQRRLPIHIAAARGHLEVCNRLLELFPEGAERLAACENTGEATLPINMFLSFMETQPWWLGQRELTAVDVATAVSVAMRMLEIYPKGASVAFNRRLPLHVVLDAATHLPRPAAYVVEGSAHDLCNGPYVYDGCCNGAPKLKRMRATMDPLLDADASTGAIYFDGTWNIGVEVLGRNHWRNGGWNNGALKNGGRVNDCRSIYQNKCTDAVPPEGVWECGVPSLDDGARDDPEGVLQASGSLCRVRRVLEENPLVPLIRKLLQLHPKAASVPCRRRWDSPYLRGEFPLHLALSVDSALPMDLLFEICECSVEAVTEWDSHGSQLPVHMAQECAIHEALVAKLSDIYPSGPTDCLMRWRSRNEVFEEPMPYRQSFTGDAPETQKYQVSNLRVQKLLAADPQAASIKVGGWLPLHHAIWRKAPEEVINSLVHAHPGSISSQQRVVDESRSRRVVYRCGRLETWSHGGF